MKHLNFILTLLTVLILATIGVAFIIGTVYASIQAPGWEQSPLYQAYLVNMNVAVLPFVVALLVVLGLCIPKRLFDGASLLKVNAGLLALTFLMALIFDAKMGLAFLLSAAAVLQLIVIVLTIGGSRRLHFERAGFFVQFGSALLHLGLVVFLIDFMLLADDANHITVFWIATTLIGLGMLSSFYSGEIARILRRDDRREAASETAAVFSES